MLEFELNYFGLGDLITFLEDNIDCDLHIGFTRPHSYRGYYDQLAFEPTSGGQSASDALEIVKPCLLQTFQGYKGGDYEMNKHTEVWFAYYGNSGGQLIGEMLMALLLVNP